IIAIVLPPPLNGLLGISESLENALAWSGDRDLAGYCVIVGADLRSGSDAECCHASPLPFVMVCGGFYIPTKLGPVFLPLRQTTGPSTPCRPLRERLLRS